MEIDYEKRHKKRIFERATQFEIDQEYYIEDMQENLRLTNFNESMPNIGNTFKNKLIELYHIFEQLGTSMFGSKKEGEECANCPAYLGQAIIEDMLDKVMDAKRNLREYNSIAGNIKTYMKKKIEEFEESNFIKRCILKSKGEPTTMDEVELPEGLNTYLKYYIEVDEKIFRYDLESNKVTIISKLVNMLRREPERISEIMNDYIIPDLQKLGIEDWIDEIKEQLEGVVYNNGSKPKYSPGDEFWKETEQFGDNEESR